MQAGFREVGMAGVLAAVFSATAGAQNPCPPTPVYSRCELVFELNDAERAAHPNPYASVNLQIEFRSPRHRTLLLPAFWDGAQRMIVRFAPLDAGEWEYRVSGNLRRFENVEGKLTATESDHSGFVIPANGHHWRYTVGQAAHLWMGDTSYGAAFIDDAAFRELVDTRAAQKFNHVRGYAIGRKGFLSGPTFSGPEQPNHDFYKRLDERVAYMSGKGITFDLILGHGANHLAEQFPMAAQRERYLRYMVARYSAFSVTWQLTEALEEYEDGRALLKQMGLFLKETDPYRHPRSAHALATSAPLLPDGWMDYVLYGSSDTALGAIEHQLYPAPGVNCGAKADSADVLSDEYRRQIWNSFMNGQYLTFGSPGSRNAAGTTAMTVWYGVIAATRFWELEPYFDLDGGRAMALPDVEYIAYFEKPSGPVEVRVEKHEYDVRWINPANGEVVPLKKFKSDKFTGEAPSRDHDWVLHISREGRKEGMLKSWKFESRPFLMQEPESASTKVPFEISEPKSDEVSLTKLPKYEAKLRRETRGTRSMMYLWTGDVPIDGQGYRVLGTGDTGAWQMRKNVVRSLPGVMNVRLYGMNANGKVYFADKIYRIVP